MSDTEARGAGTARRVWQSIAYAGMVVIAAVVALVGIAAVLVPATTGSTALTVMTSSMTPDFPAGTLVVVRPVEPAAISPGDVLTYQLRSGEPVLVTHRVTERHITADGGYLFTTKGDANPTPDPGFVQQVQIVGTVWYAVPWVGWVTRMLTDDVRAIVVPLIAGALIVYSAAMIFSGLRSGTKRSGASRSVG